jgi:hypothetical protein
LFSFSLHADPMLLSSSYKPIEGVNVARSHGSLSLLALALAATSPALLAQSLTTSALAGVVRDSAGQAVAGATLRITSPGLIGGEKTTRTSENGSYRFPVLPPGIYRITVTASGMTTLTSTELLELGRTATLNFRFPAAAGATVEVVATATNMDSAPVGVTQNYSTTEIATLPVQRSLSAIMSLTPGVNGSSAWGGDSRENAWMMDGINISDPQSNSQWIMPNPDWFSEIQVGGIGAPAEFGSFTGGYVNGLLKRGGNTTTGSFSAYYGSTSWQALDALRTPLAPGKNWDASFTVGGPLIQDKLWYFASFERKSEETTPIGAPVAVRRKDVLALTKLTWQAIPTATLEALLEYDYLSRDRRYSSSTVEPNATNMEIAPNRSWGLTWTQTLGSDKVLTLKGFGYNGRYDEPGYHGEEYGLDTYDYYQGVEYFHNALPVNYNKRARSTVSATFDWFKTGLFTAGDSHALRMGVEHEWITDEELQRNPGGIYLMGQIITNAAGVDEVWTDYGYTGTGWDIKEHATRLSAFIQDTWTVNDRLTLRPGIRFENQKGNAYGNPTVWNTSTFAPRMGATIALTADQKNVLKLHWGRFYASFSASYIDRQYQWMLPPEVDYMWGDPANGYKSVKIDPWNYATWPKPVINDPRNPPQLTINSYAPTDPNAKQPYMDETMAAYEHKFTGPWTLSVTGLYRVDKDSLLRKDMAPDTGSWLNKTYPDYRVDPSGSKSVTIPVWYSSVASDKHQWLVQTTPEAKRAYWSGTVALTRSFQDGWSLNASYTRAKRYGNSTKTNGYDTVLENPNNLVNADGLLPGFNDNEFKLHGLYELPTKTRISASYTYLSGQHWTPYVRTSRINGTYYYPNLEPRGSRSYPSDRLLDLRIAQTFSLSQKFQAELFVDIFNALNNKSILGWNNRANTSSYLLPSSADQGRTLRLGCRVTF